MKKLLTLIIVLFYFFYSTNAQSVNNVKPVKIGDTIPEAIWKMPLQVINHPQGKKIITLNEYRNKKLIILDFWATWCSPCVASLDNGVLIYNKHRNEMMLLPVASFDIPTNPMAENLMKEKGWRVPSVFDQDQFLYKHVFPPPTGSGIPHMVWIKDGRVLAVPGTEYATEENIIKAIRGEKLNMVMDTTNYLPLDYTRPLFVKNNGETSLYFKNPPYAVISRYVPGHGTGRKTEFLRVGDTSILVSVNRKLQDLLFDAYHEWIFPKLDSKTGIIWQISDSLRKRLFNGPRYDVNHLLANEMAWKDWLTKNTYGYNLRYPKPIPEKKAYNFMQQDLSKLFGPYFNLTFKIASAAKHTYAVLRLMDTKEKSIALLKHRTNRTGIEQVKDNVKYYNEHYQQVFLTLLSNSLHGLTIPAIIDSTGISPDLRIDFMLPKKLPDNVVSLNRELKRYGLILTIKTEFVPVLVVREAKSSTKN